VVDVRHDRDVADRIADRVVAGLGRALVRHDSSLVVRAGNGPQVDSVRILYGRIQ
jgi:carbamate kinase